MTENPSTESAVSPVPYAEEGDGPVALVLIAEDAVETDGLGVVAHYLAEEAGFRTVRIGARQGTGDGGSRVEDVLVVMDRLGITHAWIGGHGAGGTVARQFSVAHADHVNGLLLLGVEDVDIPLAPVIPVLIIQGSDDDVTPPANGVRLQSTAPERASIKTIDGAGHRFPLTHPIQTAFVIEEYLDWD